MVKQLCLVLVVAAGFFVGVQDAAACETAPLPGRIVAPRPALLPNPGARLTHRTPVTALAAQDAPVLDQRAPRTMDIKRGTPWRFSRRMMRHYVL